MVGSSRVKTSTEEYRREIKLHIQRLGCRGRMRSVSYPFLATDFSRQNLEPFSRTVANYSELEPLFSSGEAWLDYDR